jgi:hypothetical protein
MLHADVAVLSRWVAVDRLWFDRHPERHYRLRGLFPNESVLLDDAGNVETPPRGAGVLKIITKDGVSQAVKYFDKATIIAALDTEERIEAAWDLLAAEDVIDVRHAIALARARETKRLQ